MPIDPYEVVSLQVDKSKDSTLTNYIYGVVRNGTGVYKLAKINFLTGTTECLLTVVGVITDLHSYPAQVTQFYWPSYFDTVTKVYYGFGHEKTCEIFAGKVTWEHNM